MLLINAGCYINSCFEWESPQRSICAFLVRTSMHLTTPTVTHCSSRMYLDTFMLFDHYIISSS